MLIRNYNLCNNIRLGGPADLLDLLPDGGRAPSERQERLASRSEYSIV